MSKTVKFQLLTGYINIAGNRNSVTYRGPDNPITYPESLVLAAVHGGAEHVHTLIAVGEVERTMEEEYERLLLRYGRAARDGFPLVNGRVSLPLGDDKLPTAEEVAAGEEAALKAREEARSKKARKSKSKSGSKPDDADADADADAGKDAGAAAAAPAVPSLDALNK